MPASRTSLVLVSLLALSCGASATAPSDAGRDAPAVDAYDAHAPDGGLGPPYPVVLAHGFFGFEDFAGTGFVTYFYGVKDDLAARGETLVVTPAVDPFNSSEVRGAELLAHVTRVLAETGHARVNLVGHSQGGLDARVVAATRPDLVASVTTFATPHHGTPIADVVLGLVEDERLHELADQLVRLIGAPLWDASGEETSVFAALRLFSTPGMARFNADYPDAAGVAYYSLTGRTERRLGTVDCEGEDEPLFVSRYRTETDPVDPLLALAARIVAGRDGEVNDGLVRVADARWGRFLGCVPADHLDEIGHLLGDSPGTGNSFDHRRFYRGLIAFLRSEGL